MDWNDLRLRPQEKFWRSILTIIKEHRPKLPLAYFRVCTETFDRSVPAIVTWDFFCEKGLLYLKQTGILRTKSVKFKEFQRPDEPVKPHTNSIDG